MGNWVGGPKGCRIVDVACGAFSPPIKQYGRASSKVLGQRGETAVTGL